MSGDAVIPQGAQQDGETVRGELRGAAGEQLFDVARKVLLGSSCAVCGATFFPQRQICPHCFDDGDISEIALDRDGLVYASTVVRVPSSLGHAPPYAYGYVDLAANGLRLIGRFSGAAPESFVPGTPVELDFEPVARDENGPLQAWVFRPSGGL